MPLLFMGTATTREQQDEMRANVPESLDSHINVGDLVSVFEGTAGPLGARFVALLKHHEPYAVGVPILGRTNAAIYVDEGGRCVEKRGRLVAVVPWPTAEGGERVYPLT